MKKFKFRLQTVLELKSKILDEKLIELSKILSQIKTEEDILNQLVEKQNSLNLELLTLISNCSNINVEQVVNLRNYLPQIEDKIKSQKQLINDMKNVLEIKQDEVNAAYCDKEILEKLKDKQKKSYYQEFEKKQNNELDDITICRYSFS